MRMFNIFMAANFLGLPSCRSFAKGITLKVSNATIKITQKIYSGFSGISRKLAKLFTDKSNRPVKRKLVIIMEDEQVLYILLSGCKAEKRK